MAHMVETMAYTNQVPWHGLGEHIADAPSIPAMLKAAGLDWKVEKQPIYLANGAEVGGHFALVRDKDNKTLDVVGAHYKPVQNADAFEFFREFVEAGSATMETAGSLRGGQYVWGLAALGQSFKLRDKDEVKGYLLLASPHQQGKSLIAKFTSVRVVCNNTLTLALGREVENEFRMNHRSTFDASMIENAKEVLGIARDTMSEFERNARLLQKLNLSRDEAIAILAPIYEPDEAPELVVKEFDQAAGPRLKAIMGAYDNAPGQALSSAKGTGWGLLNAVTYWADHMASRTPDKRLQNAWFGRTAGQKEKVLEALLDRA